MVFWGLEWNNNPVGQENPSYPGRMDTSHEQETSIIYVTYVRTAHSSSEKKSGSHGRWFAPHQAPISPKAWPVWRGHANARPPRRPAKSCVAGLAGCRCNLDDPAACFVDYCSMLMWVLCAVSFSGKSCRALGSGACDRATRTPHSTPHARTAQRAPVGSVDSLRMTAVGHRAHTHTQQQQQLS